MARQHQGVGIGRRPHADPAAPHRMPPGERCAGGVAEQRHIVAHRHPGRAAREHGQARRYRIGIHRQVGRAGAAPRTPGIVVRCGTRKAEFHLLAAHGRDTQQALHGCGDRSVGAHQHAKPVAHRRAERRTLRFAESRGTARIQHQQVEAAQRLGVHRQWRIAELDAATQADLQVERNAHVRRPAAEVLTFGIGRTGEHPHAGRWRGLRPDRQRRGIGHAAARFPHLHPEQRRARQTGDTGEAETALRIHGACIDALARGVEQHHRRLRHVVHATAGDEGVARRHDTHRREFDDAARQGGGREHDAPVAERIAVAGFQSITDDMQRAHVRMPAQRGAQVRHALAAVGGRGLRQGDAGLALQRRGQGDLSGVRGHHHQRAGGRCLPRRQQGEVEQQRADRLQRAQQQEAGAGTAHVRWRTTTPRDQARPREQHAEREQAGQ